MNTVLIALLYIAHSLSVLFDCAKMKIIIIIKNFNFILITHFESTIDYQLQSSHWACSRGHSNYHTSAFLTLADGSCWLKLRLCLRQSKLYHNRGLLSNFQELTSAWLCILKYIFHFRNDCSQCSWANGGKNSVHLPRFTNNLLSV